MEKILIMSDIHGNLTALNKILEIEETEKLSGIILLGDIIDYGPRSNEVIQRIKEIPENLLLVNLWGNHEHSIISMDDSQFSSERGKSCVAYTRRNLTNASRSFLENDMEQAGKQEFELDGRHCLAIHGSLADVYWESISHEEAGEEYAKYDFVFSGHSHIPHFFEHFYASDCKKYRNKKRTVFLNPGSVGQPRNHNPNAHYAVLELEDMTVQMKTAVYDVEQELALFTEEVDAFYRERLKIGI